MDVSTRIFCYVIRLAAATLGNVARSPIVSPVITQGDAFTAIVNCAALGNLPVGEPRVFAWDHFLTQCFDFLPKSAVGKDVTRRNGLLGGEGYFTNRTSGPGVMWLKANLVNGALAMEVVRDQVHINIPTLKIVSSDDGKWDFGTWTPLYHALSRNSKNVCKLWLQLPRAETLSGSQAIKAKFTNLIVEQFIALAGVDEAKFLKKFQSQDIALGLWVLFAELDFYEVLYGLKGSALIESDEFNHL
jgi:hypothetical protein